MEKEQYENESRNLSVYADLSSGGLPDNERKSLTTLEMIIEISGILGIAIFVYLHFTLANGYQGKKCGRLLDMCVEFIKVRCVKLKNSKRMILW